MRMKWIVAVTSPTAFLKVGQTPGIDLAIENLKSMGASLPLTVAVNQEQSEALGYFLGNQKLDVVVLICDPSDPHSFAEALVPHCINFDALLFHDASRPLTTREQFEHVLAAFNDETDAVRPAMAFTETLKILDANSVIKKTLERSTVLRISTPELIRVSAIDVKGTDCGWFLPLRKEARTFHVEGSPEGLRINTLEDRDLMELIAD
jgi:2-C-methyl-D-erythritol 4-phosphate cytidylyltransferase